MTALRALIGSIFGPNAEEEERGPDDAAHGRQLRMKLAEYEARGQTPATARRRRLRAPVVDDAADDAARAGRADEGREAHAGALRRGPASHVHTIKLSAAALKEQYGDDHGRAHQAVAEGVRRRSSRVVIVDGEPSDRRPSGEGDSLSSTVGSGHRRASGARVLPVDASLEEASPAAERNASGENLKGP